MNKIRCFSFLMFWLSILPITLSAQTPEENQKNYLFGKNLLKEARFDAAAQVFLPLTAEAANNAFSKPASFLYALASFKAGNFEAAKSMCLQTLQRYPDWEQKDDIYYLLSNAYFELNKTRLALHFLTKMNYLKKDSENIKKFYLSKINPIDTLRAIQNDYPADMLIATILAIRLSENVLDEKNKMLLNFLIQEYKLDITLLSKNTKSILKDVYNIALLLPFQLNEIDPKISKRSNQYILDFYEGIKLAVDSLKAKGIEVNLYSYDTEKDATIINSIISLPELKTMDLIVGPVYPVQMPIVADFSKKNNIINISPFSANSKIIENNEFSYLFQPTIEIQAGAAAKFASTNFRFDSVFVDNYTPPKPKYRNQVVTPLEHKNVIILYGNELKDSLIAAYHKDSCIANGLNVSNFEKINRTKVLLLRTLLGDCVKVSKSNHVFVSTSDEVIAANIMSLMEVGRNNTPLITTSNWLLFSLISYEQFEKRNVHFIHPDYYDYSNLYYRNFKSTYIKRTNIYPSTQSLQGFDLMMYFGEALKNYGTYFKYGLNETGFKNGYIFQGYDFSNSYSNKRVSITRFKEKNLLLVNGQ